MADPQARASAGRALAYDRRFVALHWLLAALIGAAFVMGLVMVELRFSPLRLRLFNWHKWLGIAILALSAARLCWRLATRRLRPLPADMPAWQLAAARGTHFAFYALFLIVPLSGWLYTSAVGVPVVWLGWLALPDLTPVDKPFAEEVLKPLHSVSAYLLAALVVVHALAALKHQLVDRDRLLAEMWPWWPGRRQA
jgi:cytochrome b561